jgi:flagellin-like protein
MVFGSKKGMSPLIATVLLIAFAVALGAMIMNWSAGVEAESHVKVEVCEDVSIVSIQNACYTGNALRFDVRNNGDKRIDGLLLGSSNAASELDIRIKDSALIVGENTQRTVPFFYDGGEVRLEFIPLINHETGLKECPDAGFVQTTIPSCEG